MGARARIDGAGSEGAEKGGDEGIVFWTNPQSRGRMVRWMLEEVGAPYRVERVDYGPAMKSPDYLAVNPMGKVPALRQGGVVITETAAICAWLADAFPAAGLAPPLHDPLRGAWLRWLFFAAGPVEAAVTAKALGLLAPADKAAVAGYGSFERMVQVLELAVAPGPFLLGDRFSAADVYLGGQMSFGLRFGTLPDRPALAAYAARLEARPAARRAAELDDAMLAA